MLSELLALYRQKKGITNNKYDDSFLLKDKELIKNVKQAEKEASKQYNVNDVILYRNEVLKIVEIFADGGIAAANIKDFKKNGALKKNKLSRFINPLEIKK